ncbi:putative transcriptional regulator [Kitasatospora sp. MAP12-15]|uniref:MarR family transcriptional regulator n=1 Tax=unclassified Kitasatospora TaxID=2633591 RepID=UPI0024743DD8|nr:replication/maintenance protein RepL [Kitasatospora sp. MAP12-44]MDH6107842.1 putative transcriptional regulator [Kitasatospora sp. MAP12-44]
MTAAEQDQGTGTFLTAEGSVLTAQDLSRALPLYRLTTLQYDVWHTVLGEMTDGGYVTLTLEEIADRLGTAKSNISPAMGRLAELGLIWRVSNGLHRINPRIAFKGSQEEWIEALDEVPADVPEVVLPSYRRRPPRSNRGGLAATG